MKIFLTLFLLLAPAIAFGQAHPPVNGNVTLPSNSSTARVQMPSLASQSCSFVADSGNTGNIYFGGATVTNAGGANKGFAIAAGTGIFNISVTNLSAVFFATATNSNIVQWSCN